MSKPTPHLKKKKKGGGGAKFLKTKRAKLPYNTASLKSQRISHKALSVEISQSIINDDIHYFCKLIVVSLKTKNTADES